MYFYNARWTFKVPPIKETILGSIIAASAIPPVDLQRRSLRKLPHLERRLLDPQLYMATLDPDVDPQTVSKLAAYPWFHGSSLPEYKSGEHGTRTQWKKKHKDELVSKWTRSVPSAANDISQSARAAVEFQIKLGCDGILLAAPLTTIADQTLQSELAWIDAGIEACKELKPKCPVYATVALSEAILHVSALGNPIVHSLSNHIAASPELSGAYIVLEQNETNSYFWSAKDPLMSVLVLIDDLCRGANKQVITNYVGTFGLVASALGAKIWASGYLLSQRRLCLTAKGGRAYPRYHSLALAGDIGLREDMASIRDAGIVEKFMTPTNADAVLRKALQQNRTPADVPEWAYTQSNLAAAQEHYLTIASGTANKLEAMTSGQRMDWVLKWLKNAVELVGILEKNELVGMSTDIKHQKVWLRVFEDWRNYAKQ